MTWALAKHGWASPDQGGHPCDWYLSPSTGSAAAFFGPVTWQQDTVGCALFATRDEALSVVVPKGTAVFAVELVAAEVTVVLPGKFDGFFSGTSVAQGEGNYSRDPVLQAGADLLYERYRDRFVVRAGRGYRVRLDRLTLDAVTVLRDYADTCVFVNEDEPDHAEVAAARKVLAECDRLLSTAGLVRPVDS